METSLSDYECFRNLEYEERFLDWEFRLQSSALQAFNGNTTTRVGAAIWEYGNMLSKVSTKDPAHGGCGQCGDFDCLISLGPFLVLIHSTDKTAKLCENDT